MTTDMDTLLGPPVIVHAMQLSDATVHFCNELTIYDEAVPEVLQNLSGGITFCFGSRHTAVNQETTDDS